MFTKIIKFFKPLIIEDSFDKRFGFILKYKIDSKESYLLTKNYFFRNRYIVKPYTPINDKINKNNDDKF